MSLSVFAHNLRNHRINKGLTQSALGELSGHAQGHISNLERGVLAPSMAVLDRLAETLGISPAEFLMTEVSKESHIPVIRGVPIINERSRAKLNGPRFRRGKVLGDSDSLLCLPDLRGEREFAAFLPDSAMDPAFGKGDLVIFSLTKKPQDGDTCLIGMSDGQVMFRTVFAMPGGQWRLQPSNPKYKPLVVKASRRLKMWPAVGFWRMLRPGSSFP